MTSRQIQIFLCVAASKNFTLAGQQLFLSQPVISYHIKALEKELGFALLVRSTHGVALTEAGENLYSSLQVLAPQFSRALEQARRLAEKGSGELRICFANPTSPTMMGELLNRFYAVLGTEKIELVRRSYDDVLAPLLFGAADLLLSYPHFFREGLNLEKKTVCRVWTSCMMAPSHALAQKNSLRLPDLRGQRLLFPDCRNIRIEHAQFYRLIENENEILSGLDDTPQTFEQVQGLAMAGRGIMLVRTLDDDRHENIDGLVSIPLADVGPDSLIAVWQPERLPPVGQRLIKSLPRPAGQTPEPAQNPRVPAARTRRSTESLQEEIE